MSNSKPGPDDDATVAARPPSLPPVTATGAETLGGLPGQSPATPPRFGDFVLLGELGQGGMGVVYRAEDPRLKREVAIKVMLPQFAVNPQAKARFVREARAQAKVEHDHVAAIFSVADHDGLPYIVMPLLKGMTLQAAVKANPRPPLNEVIRIGREVAEGLAAAHEKGLVHRDIKPANIWLEGKKLRVKVLDFGLARTTVEAEATEGSDGPVTNAGAVVGTPAYMGPEQGRGLPVDGRTDLWSLGVMLYQMTVGELPFRGPTSLAILTSLAFDHPPPPITRNPAVPQALSDFVMRLLAKDVGYRPPTAEIAVEELRAIEAGLVNAVRVIPLDAPPPIILAPTGPDPFAELDATEVNSVPDAELAAGLPADALPKARGGFPMWLVAGVLLAVAGVVGLVLSQLGKKPEPVVAKEEPPPVVKPISIPKPKDNSDPVKKAVAWVLKSGGTVTSGTRGGAVYVTDPDVFPGTIQSISIPGGVVGNEDVKNLEGLTELYSLVIRNSSITDAGLKTLAKMPLAKTLEGIDLGQDFGVKNLTDAGLDHIATSFPNLTYLGLGGQFSPDGLAKLRKLTKLQRIGLSSDLTDDHLASFKDLPFTEMWLAPNPRLTDTGLANLGRMSSLTSFTIDGTGITDKGLKGVGDRMPALEILGLADKSPVTNLGIQELRRTRVRQLSIGTSALTPETVTPLPRCEIRVSGKIIAEPSDVHFREASRLLSRGGMLVGVRPAGGDEIIVKSVAELPEGPFTLTRVSIVGESSVPFSDADLKRLEATPTLIRVDSQAPTITNAGFRSLAASKATLEGFFLPNGLVTDEGLRAVGQCTNLVSVHVGGSRSVSDAGLAHLTGLTKLASLTLHDTAVADAGLMHIAALPALKSLHLDRTFVSDTGVETLAGMKGLTELHVDGTRVTVAGYAKLKKALPNCKIEWEDPNRSVAKLFLERAPFVNGVGGFLFDLKLSDGKTVNVGKAADLPAGPFTIVGLHRAGPQPPALTDADMKRLEAVPTLTVFSAHGLAIGVDGLRSLLALKKSLTNLVFGAVTDEHLKLIGEFTELTDLQFGGPGTRVSDDGIAHLAGLTKLLVLCMDDTSITDAGLKKHLGSLPSLKVLSLTNSLVSDDSVPTLTNMKMLTKLYLVGTRISAAGFERLKKDLPGCKIEWEELNRYVAKSLLDRGVPVGVKLANGTVVALKKGQELPTEPFTINGVGGDGSQSITDDILKRLEATPTLAGIVGSGSPITGVGLRSLVASKATLWHVHLGGQPFTDDDMKTLAELKATIGLNIAFAKITDEGLKPLATLPLLDNLHLGGTGITDAGVVHLKNCKKLTKLFLSKTKVTAAGIDELKQALPQCWIEWDGGVIDPAKKP